MAEPQGFRMKIHLACMAGALAAILVSAEAQAGINGTSVDLSAYYPDMSSLYSDAGSAIVGPGVDFPFNSLPGYDSLSFDLSDTQISICCNAVFADAAFNGFAFTFSSVVPTGAFVDPSSAYAPVGISLIGNTLFLNYQNVVNLTNGASVIDLQFGGVSVPEPATWALMLSGFGLAGAALRRRRTMVAA